MKDLEKQLNILKKIMNFLYNPWFIGIGGGIVSSLIVFFVTRAISNRKGNKEYLQRIKTANNEILYSLDVKRTRKEFTKEASLEIIKMLTMQWHSYNEGDGEIVLTKRQRELAKSLDGRQIRIKGVAGSGKTQILASSAVKSQLRTG